MPNFGSILKLLKYVPVAIQVAQGLRQPQQQDLAPQLRETKEELGDIRKQLGERIESLEGENAHLKSRLKDTEASLAILQVLAWTALGIGGAGFVLGLLALILHR